MLAAACEPRLRCHDIVDERSAAFFALGIARATGTPPLLLCTSGTAGAHYFPAVVEAGQAFVPLLVLTADRPLELQGCAAPQTIDQLKLFGDHARAYVELGVEMDSPRGRIALMRGVREGRLPLTAEVEQHLDQCLGCRACEAVCRPRGAQSARANLLLGTVAEVDPRSALPSGRRPKAFENVAGKMGRPRLARSNCHRP